MIKMIKKEGLLKRLKNIEKNQNVNNHDKNKKTNDESELSSAKSESSKKTSIRDDVANIEGVGQKTKHKLFV